MRREDKGEGGGGHRRADGDRRSGHARLRVAPPDSATSSSTLRQNRGVLGIPTIQTH
jgi:hypothetical protein